MSRTKDLLNRLESSGYRINSLKYPLTLGSDEYNHAILFNIYQSYANIMEDKRINRGRAVRSSGVDTYETVRSKRLRENNPNLGSQENVGKRSLLKNTNVVQTTDAISLYMPQGISFDYNIEYEHADIQGAGLSGAALEAVKNAADSFEAGNKATLSEAIRKNLTGTGGQAIKEQAGQAWEDFSGGLDRAALLKIQTGNLGDMFSVYTRQAQNPHMEYIFRSVSPRTFAFDFVFTPQSEKENENIHNIIYTFKRNALPRIKEEISGVKGVFYDYPAQFDISFISNGEENEFIHKISTCVLSDIKTDPMGAGTASFMRHQPGKGSPPSIINMSLEFKELEIMSQQRIDQGY